MTIPAEATLPQIASGAEQPRVRTATERNWLYSLLLVVGSVAVFYGGYLLEMDRGLWNREIRLVRDPSESAMRFTALSHFAVALLFMSTSRRMKKAKSWLWFAASLAAGIVLCLGYAQLGVVNPLVATTFFFTYFLVHDFRDQVMFYVANGDAGELSDRAGRMLGVAPLFLIGAGVALVTVAAAFGAPGTGPALPTFGNVGPQTRMMIGSTLFATLIVACGIFVKAWRNAFATPLREVLRRHRPILMVFGGSILVLAVSAIAGASGDAIILLHVCSWYVFTIHQLKKRKPAVAPRFFTWNWIRSTMSGFNFVHIGSFIVFVILGAIWAYGFRNDTTMGAFAVTVGRVMFPYWTILHVSVSVPKM
jgi:hypothetical protein